MDAAQNVSGRSDNPKDEFAIESRLLFWGILLSFWILTLVVSVVEYVISVSRLRGLVSVTTRLLESGASRFGGKIPNLEALRDTTLRLGVALVDLVMGVIVGVQTFALAPSVVDGKVKSALPDEESEALVCFQVRAELLLLLCLPMLLDAVIAFVRSALVFDGHLLMMDSAIRCHSPARRRRAPKLFYGALLVTLLCCLALFIFPLEPVGREFCLQSRPIGPGRTAVAVAVSASATLAAVVFTMIVSYGVFHMWTRHQHLQKVLLRGHLLKAMSGPGDSKADAATAAAAAAAATAKPQQSDRSAPDESFVVISSHDMPGDLTFTPDSVALVTNPHRHTTRNRKELESGIPREQATVTEVKVVSKRHVVMALWRAMSCPWLPWLLATLVYPYLSNRLLPANVLLLLVAIESCAAILWSAFLNVTCLS